MTETAYELVNVEQVKILVDALRAIACEKVNTAPEETRYLGCAVFASAALVNAGVWPG